MGMQPLSVKTLRRVVRTTGLPVLFGSGMGKYWHLIVTRDHRHLWWHTIDGTVEPDERPRPCTSTCSALFVNLTGERQRVAVNRPLLPLEDLYRVLAERNDPLPLENTSWSQADLDRCEHGRHSIDSCAACPGGQSTGNRFLTAARLLRIQSGGQSYARIGTTRGGDAIWVVAHAGERG